MGYMSLYSLNNRGQAILDIRHKDYLFKAISFSHFLYDQTLGKLNFFYGLKVPLSSNHILAEILIKSEFGDHPLAQETYPLKTNRWANNLTLLELDESWAGKFLKYEDKFYKSFKNWDEYSVHLTDTLVFRKSLIDKYLLTNPSMEYNSLINAFSLEEFEIGNSPAENK